MKFGKRLLAELEQNWADHYLPFKDLKKVIGSDGPDRAERFEAIFRESLRRIQRHTSTVALEVHRDERRAVELGQLLKEFLDLNFEGIRKILKKYAKKVGGDAAEKLTRQLQAEASAAAAFSTMPALCPMVSSPMSTPYAACLVLGATITWSVLRHETWALLFALLYWIFSVLPSTLVLIKPGVSSLTLRFEKDKKGKVETSNRCAFAFVRHATEGFLVLRSHKAKKGEQTPGGHVDVAELAAAEAIGTPEALDAMFRAVAARELYEETGLCIRQDLGRLRRIESDDHPFKVFFLLEVNDGDFSQVALEPGAVPGVGGTGSLTLRLSREHTAWRFEKDKAAAAKAMELHSGGVPSAALGRPFGYQMLRSHKAKKGEHYIDAWAARAGLKAKLTPAPAIEAPAGSKGPSRITVKVENLTCRQLGKMMLA